MPSFRTVQQRELVIITHLSPYGFSMLPPESINVIDVRGRLFGADILLLQLMSEKTRRHQNMEYKQLWDEYLVAAGTPHYKLKWVYRENCPTLRQEEWKSMGEFIGAIESHLTRETTPACRTELLQQQCHVFQQWAQQLPAVEEKIKKLEATLQVATMLKDSELQQRITADLQVARYMQLVEKTDEKNKFQRAVINKKDTKIKKLQEKEDNLTKLAQ